MGLNTSGAKGAAVGRVVRRSTQLQTTRPELSYKLQQDLVREAVEVVINTRQE
jgi:hypothetical protein